MEKLNFQESNVFIKMFAAYFEHHLRHLINLKEKEDPSFKEQQKLYVKELEDAVELFKKIEPDITPIAYVQIIEDLKNL